MNKKRKEPKCARCGSNLIKVAGLWRCEPCDYTVPPFKREHMRPVYNGHVKAIIDRDEDS